MRHIQTISIGLTRKTKKKLFCVCAAKQHLQRYPWHDAMTFVYWDCIRCWHVCLSDCVAWTSCHRVMVNILLSSLNCTSDWKVTLFNLQTPINMIKFKHITMQKNAITNKIRFYIKIFTFSNNSIVCLADLLKRMIESMMLQRIFV